MNIRTLRVLAIACLLLTGCGGNVAAQPTVTNTPLPATDTATPIPPTATLALPTATPEPAIIIVLSQGTHGTPLNLQVKKGDYKIVSGATLREGSNIGVAEDWLTFPSGLVIEIGTGGATLQGTTYEEGDILVVNEAGGISPKEADGEDTIVPAGQIQATADFGKFDLALNPEKNTITKITFQFAGWTCGPTTMSGEIAVERQSGWPITGDSFTIEQRLDVEGKQTITIRGTFDTDRAQASGTWDATSHGTSCSGAWNSPAGGNDSAGQADAQASVPTTLPTGGGTLFSDDFSSNANEWEIGMESDERQDTKREIADGKYVITMTSKDDYCVTYTYLPAFQGDNFILTMDVTVLKSTALPGDMYLELNLREGDSAWTHYAFTLYNDGSSDLDLWPTGEFEDNVSLWESSASQAFALEQGVKKSITMEMNGPKITASVDGKVISTVTDSTLDAGSVSIILGLTEPGHSLAVAFDNIVIQAIP